MVILAATACEDPAPTGEAAKPSAPSASAAAKSPTGPPAVDKSKACADIDQAIRTALDKVKEAEAIGPPAGHYAVSAAFYAGSAGVEAGLANATGTVAEAGKKVSAEMAAIGDKYVDSRSRPDKAPLDAAVAQFRAACA